MKLLDGADRVAIVAGAAGGIGAAALRGFRAAGSQVAAADLNREQLDVLTASDDGAMALALDCATEKGAHEAIAQTVAHFGRLDYLVNSIGVVGAGTLADTSLDDWDRILRVNLTSAFLLCRAAHPHLKERRGAVVLLSSVNGVNGGSSVSGAPYAMAKAGLINMTRYLAMEWAVDRIRVNCVAPGPVETPMIDRLTEADHAALKARIPLQEYASAEQVAAQILYLCSDHAATTTGTVANISGGLVLD